ncbi:MAG: 6-phosphogluconolactonase [Oligoflexia bacterium]|nr:6-phosphogluconolactonase [Oligoflexia bacterium]
MKLIHCKDPQEVATTTVDLLKAYAQGVTGALNIFLPTGGTPTLIYKGFSQEKDFWSKKLCPIQIDEFIDSRRLFYSQLREQVLLPLGVENKSKLIDPSWSDAQMLMHVEDVISEKIHVSLLGLGPNGHVGFHEPGQSGLSFMGGRVIIADETRDRVTGANTNDVFTFGAGAFMRAEKIIMVVIGKEKSAILKKVLESEPTPLIPATLLKSHSNLTVIIT